MLIDASHPAIRFAQELFGDDGWEVTDALGREGEAVVVELRRSGMRRTFICVARDGTWVKPSLIMASPSEVPEQRRPVTVRHQPFQHGGTHGSGWPGPDGGPPETVWMAVDGFAAADVESVEVSTARDRHEAAVARDGSFLTLLRAGRREEPRIRLRLTTGDSLDVRL